MADKGRYPALDDATTEPIFPPELALAKPRALHLRSAKVSPPVFRHDGSVLQWAPSTNPPIHPTITTPQAAWYRPTSLASLLDLKARFPESRLVAGNTEVGIETKFKHVAVPVIVSPTAVPELGAIRATEQVGGVSCEQMVRVGGWVGHRGRWCD